MPVHYFVFLPVVHVGKSAFGGVAVTRKEGVLAPERAPVVQERFFAISVEIKIRHYHCNRHPPNRLLFILQPFFSAARQWAAGSTAKPR
jgi:hypothetical protein